MPLLALKHLLVAIDPHDPDGRAMEAAVALAHSSGASLHVVSVDAKGDPDRLDTLRAQLLDRARKARPLQRDPSIYALTGDAAREIESVADRVRANVIILGRHRAGRSSAQGIGGTALAVVTNASCPCLVASAGLSLPLQRVLVPVDTSDTARGALLVGLSWASALRTATQAGGGGATLTALYVSVGGKPERSPAPPASVEREVELVREAGGSWAGVTVHGATAAARDVPTGIATYLEHHPNDLVVMGTRGLGLDAVGRLGSVAAATAQSVDLPFLLVPPAIWMSLTESKPR